MATIHEYTQLTPSLARVTVTLHGKPGSDFLQEVSAALGEDLAPVSNSFRVLRDTTCIGFVYASRATIPLSDAKPGAGYREIAANIYMDDNDVVWDVKNGAGGRYLARQGATDMSALLEQARVSPSGSVPRMSRVQAAVAEPNDFVAFVNPGPRTSEVDYGACLGKDAKTGDYVVLSSLTSQMLLVKPALIVSSVTLNRADMPTAELLLKREAADAGRSRVAASGKDGVLTPKEYYTKLYSYAPEYLAEVIKQIDAMGF